MTLLRMDGLNKSFRGLHAVRDVSFQVAEGTIHGVIGPNGAGKTTLFNLMAGALRPDSGSVTLGGVDITGKSPHQIARAGMSRTFQLMRPFGTMTVLENVAVAGQASGLSRRDAVEGAKATLARLGLARWTNDESSALSTAGLKRLELARALATRPRVLLLDEVMAGLVPAERLPVMELLESLRKEEGMTLVFVEHIMAAVMRLSDTVLVVDQGTVLTKGTPEQVTQDPRVIEAYLGEDPSHAAD